MIPPGINRVDFIRPIPPTGGLVLSGDRKENISQRAATFFSQRYNKKLLGTDSHEHLLFEYKREELCAEELKFEAKIFSHEFL